MDILDKIDQESGDHFFERILGPRERIPKTSTLPFDLEPEEIVELSEDLSVVESSLDIFLLHTICEILNATSTGADVEVLFLKFSHKIKIQDFATVLRHGYGLDEERVGHALKKLHILEVFTLEEFHLAMVQARRHLYGNKMISLLVCDCISAFYHLDKQIRSRSFESYCSSVVGSIVDLAREFGISALYGKQEYFAPDKKKFAPRLKYRLAFESPPEITRNEKQILVKVTVAASAASSTDAAGDTHHIVRCKFVIESFTSVKLIIL